MKRTPFVRKRKKRKAAAMRAMAKNKRLGMSFHKKGAWRSKAFRERVVQQPCLVGIARVALGLPMECYGKIDPHHVKVLESNGTRKPSDAVCVPVCRMHHTINASDSVHGKDGEKKFWTKYGIDPREFISRSPEGRAELERIATDRLREAREHVAERVTTTCEEP